MILQMRFSQPTSPSSVSPSSVSPHSETGLADVPRGGLASQLRDSPSLSGATLEQSPEPLRISCGDCVMEHTEVCSDCVVTHLLDRIRFNLAESPVEHAQVLPSGSPVVVIDTRELELLSMLQAAGLAPQNRHLARHPSVRARDLAAV